MSYGIRVGITRLSMAATISAPQNYGCSRQLLRQVRAATALAGCLEIPHRLNTPTWYAIIFNINVIIRDYVLPIASVLVPASVSVPYKRDLWIRCCKWRRVKCPSLPATVTNPHQQFYTINVAIPDPRWDLRGLFF